MTSFFCVFITSIKMVEMDLFIICCEPSTRFLLNHFKLFLELIDHCKYNVLCLTWWKEFTYYIDYSTLFLEGQLYILNATNSTNTVMNKVTKKIWITIMKIWKLNVFNCCTFDKRIGQAFSTTRVFECHYYDLFIVLIDSRG
jgi:hypothetical protein